MNMKNSKGSVLLMVTVFAMIFLVLAIATMKILLQTDQDQSMDSEIARIRLFYAADGISEIAMYAAAKNLMYDPRGHNPRGDAGLTGSRRNLTSYQMEGYIWPNVWSTASGVHFDFSLNVLTSTSAGVLINKETTYDNTAGIIHKYIRPSSAAVVATNLGDPDLSPPDVIGKKGGTAMPYVYDVDFNVKYKSNAKPMATLGDTIRYRQSGGENRQIWYMHLTPENPNYVEAADYTSSNFWCVHHSSMSPDNNILVRATMYQEFILPPIDQTTGTRDTTDPDLIGRGDGWPSVDVVSKTQWPKSVRQFTNDNGAYTPVTMTTNWFYQENPNLGNHYNGGNARRRFFVIIAEARFTDQSAGGVFEDIYKIETRFFIEDERSYGATGRQYDKYLADLNSYNADTHTPAQITKPRVKFYFRSRIPKPI